jgi:hypothetical protein
VGITVTGRILFWLLVSHQNQTPCLRMRLLFF